MLHKNVIESNGGFRMLNAEELIAVSGGDGEGEGNEIIVTGDREGDTFVPEVRIALPHYMFSGSSAPTGTGSGTAICIGGGSHGAVLQFCVDENGESSVRVGVGTPGLQVDMEESDTITGGDVNTTNAVYGVDAVQVLIDQFNITRDLAEEILRGIADLVPQPSPDGPSF